jgi:hypothetical protein
MITAAPQPATREAAIAIVTAANRGDVATVTAILDAYDVAEFVPALHAALNLTRALAVQLRTAPGLMACDVWLAETAREHPSRDTRLAAALILAHAMTRYPPTETVTAAETFGDVFNVGASTFNQVCISADERIVEVLAAVTVLWHHLLPELNTAAGPCVIGNTAGRLWSGDRRAEPAPPKPEGTETLRFRTKAEDSPPQPTLTAPPEAEVVRRPPRPTIPAGAPVSYRGLSILLRQERGLE